MAGKTRTEAEMRLIHEWLKRPEINRLAKDVLTFYEELVRQGSPLLEFEVRGDKCEALNSLLRDYILESRKLTG